MTDQSRSLKRTVTSGLLMSFSLIAGILMAHQASAFEISKPKAVIELFTSQGCSSCPPADAALRQLNSGDDYLGLAMHVDYWDRLGWKDTFASHENTERQWLYARSLGERQVYTPQAIINGRTHIVGSRKTEIIRTADTFSDGEKGLTVNIQASTVDDILKVTIARDANSDHATLYLFYFNPDEEVAIKRGENAGRKIHYSNVVGKVEMVGMVGDSGLNAEFAIADMRQKGYKGCALILQSKKSDGNPGPILGATVIKDL